MELADLIKTIDSQIPIIAVDVLSPEENTIIQWLTEEIKSKLELPVYFWNLGVKSLERVRTAADGGIVYEEVANYKRPAHADKILFLLNWIEEYAGSGVFVIGDLHPMVAKDSPSSLSWEVVVQLKNLYHRLKPYDKRLILIGQNIRLHDSLIRLIPCCEVPLPTTEQILDHLDSYLPLLCESAESQNKTWQDCLTESDAEDLSRAALGLTLEEISDFLRLYVKQQQTKTGIIIDSQIVNAAVKYKTRMLAQMGIGLGKPATLPFGGLDLFRDWLIRRRRLFTQEARLYNLPRPKGVLLAGPPGTGKSLIAKNIASILNLPLLQLDIAGMLGSLVGESEGNIQRALKTANAIAPCVLLIDEVEKALSGSNDSSGVSQRILGTILTFMSDSDSGVFVVATANNVTALPVEFRRKGRFDETFFIDLPTTAERQSILKIHLDRFKCDLDAEYIEAIAASTAKFSGSELENLAAEAATLAFDAGRPQQIYLNDLETCKNSITPLAIQDPTAIEQMQQWSRSARAASTPEQTNTPSLRTPRMRKLD